MKKFIEFLKKHTNFVLDVVRGLLEVAAFGLLMPIVFSNRVSNDVIILSSVVAVDMIVLIIDSVYDCYRYAVANFHKSK